MRFCVVLVTESVRNYRIFINSSEPVRVAGARYTLRKCQERPGELSDAALSKDFVPSIFSLLAAPYLSEFCQFKTLRGG